MGQLIAIVCYEILASCVSAAMLSALNYCHTVHIFEHLDLIVGDNHHFKAPSQSAAK
jgi:hypothetical protein